MLHRITHSRLLPGQVAALAGVFVILVGTFLVLLPWSTPVEHPLSLLDALFMAVSATCVTGLIVADPSTDFPLFGQLVILALIQIGGLGYALIATLFFLAAGRRISLWHRMLLAESLSTLDLAGLVKSAKFMVAGTLLIEAVGATILAWRFIAHDEVSGFHALYQGIFHAVSAVNNAGFSLFSSNLLGYKDDPILLVILAVLIVMGGIGFPAIQDIVERLCGQRMRLQVA
ncbi:MAG: hypothetical protein D6690_04955 [Nitrospirae bacterium]|nr:MAG: hypothetical protein D6690_04955 [Nitrospirota bacterium]